MQAPSPPLLGFRPLQAIMDLRAVVGRQPQAALRGILARVPPTDLARGADRQALTRVILRQGCRLETEADLPLRDALLLAAAQPEADRHAFAGASAILLADRLQDGLGADDLGSFWDAFRPAYFALDPFDRAAIVQGFMAGDAIGRVRCTDPPPPEVRVSQGPDRLRRDLIGLARTEAEGLAGAVAEAVEPESAASAARHLDGLLAGVALAPLTGDSPAFPPLFALASDARSQLMPAATALLLAEALSSGDGEGWFGITLWSGMIETWLGLPARPGRAILAGIRHLYESDPGWVPQPQLHASPAQATRLPLLPVLDATYQPRRPDATAG